MTPKRLIRVRVPATTSNLGPGFDCLGLALGLYNDVELRVVSGRSPDPGSGILADVRIETAGEGAKHLPEGAGNLVLQGAQVVWGALGRPRHRLLFRVTNRIPVGRGLGSSAAALVGGALAANALVGNPWTRDQLLNRLLHIEHHPDNLVPCLSGGFTIASTVEGSVVYRRLPPPKGIVAVLAVPDFEVMTKEARAVLPAQVPFEDAVFNLSRTALLVAALATGEGCDDLFPLMEDRLHQPFRKRFVPMLQATLEAARAWGAVGGALSGSGSCICVLVKKHRKEVVEAIGQVFETFGAPVKVLTLPIDARGAVVR